MQWPNCIHKHTETHILPELIRTGKIKYNITFKLWELSLTLTYEYDYDGDKSYYTILLHQMHACRSLGDTGFHIVTISIEVIHHVNTFYGLA